MAAVRRRDRSRARSERAGWFDELVPAEVVVVGSGAAGLTAALGCAPRAVTLLTKTRLGEGGSSAWAQGGIAAAVAGDDSPELHAADTLAVAAGLGDRRAVDLLTGDGPARIAALLALGARFDRAAGGGSGEAGGPWGLALGREAAHSRRRILHAHGDATGAELVRTLTAAVRRASHVRLAAEETALDLVLDRGRVAGVLALAADGRRRLHLAPAVVLATGGCGQLYLHTTNPAESTGDGLAMAARAGARLVDLEFVQFHPTALAAGLDPMPLLTEALRGEGAVIVDGRGRRFLAEEHPLAELAPRDVVARAIWRRRAAGEPVYLDARAAVGEAFPERFPTVFAACRRAGLDPRRQPIPVSPAAHYHMGGIDVDLSGRSSLPGLWACGEVASTGVHGANRLASNSLLEALVFGARVADDLRGRLAALPGARPEELSRLRLPGDLARSRSGVGDRAPDAPSAGSEATAEARAELRRLMWEKVGVARDGAGLATAVAEFERLAAKLPSPDSRPAVETANLLTVARLVAAAALVRPESRGAHQRDDHPATDPAWRRRLYAVVRPDGDIEITAGPLLDETPLEAAGAERAAPAPRAAATAGGGR